MESKSKKIKRYECRLLSWNGKEASDLYGIGKYGSDSYKIFYKNEIPANVQDKELRRYIKNL